MNEQQTVSLADAKRVIAAGETHATEIGQPMNIAVVDAGGNLVAHVRMDGAWLGSVVLAHAGWQGVCVMAAVSGVAALGVRLWPVKKLAPCAA